MAVLVSNDECRGTHYQITRSNVETFVLVFGALFFFYWTLHKILVSLFNMQPVIRTTSSLRSLPNQSTTNANVALSNQPTTNANVALSHQSTTNANVALSNQSTANANVVLSNESIEITVINHTLKNMPEIDSCVSATLALQLSKRLDKNNEFRIRQKGSILFVKSIVLFLGLFCIFVLIAFDNPSWFLDTFWHLNRCSVNYIYVKYQCIVVASFYCWEVAMRELYYKNGVVIYLHHWLSVAGAIYLLIGGYSPFVANHAINIALYWVVPFVMGFRYNYCELYPNITQILVHFCYVFFVILVIFTTVIDILLFVRLCIVGFGGDTMPMYSAIASIVFVAAWTLDDYLLIQTLKKWRLISYERDLLF
eukprot:241096_1